MSESTVTIPESEYDQLMRDADKLSCLEAMGVDNWQGYDDAMEMLSQMHEMDK